MRITLSIPDPVARRFQAAVPARQRSRLVTRLLERELAERDDTLAAACRAANRDRALVRAIQEWQSFDDRIEECLPAIQRGDLWWVSLGPTQGSEIIDRLRQTVVVIPLSTAAKSYGYLPG